MHKSCKTKADLDTLIPGLSEVWKQIRAEQEIRTQKVSVHLHTEPTKVVLGDGFLCRRFGLRLKDMTLSEESLEVSSGEWACHGGDNHDQAIMPELDYAVVQIVWNDFYRSASMDICLHPSNVAKSLPQ